MVEIKIIENEERNEYLIEPYQAFLGARYDNLSDEIKVTFPQKEIDNGSSCTMIITNGDEPIDCVTVYNDKVFKLESPATQYKQVFIGFSFQKADGYIKNTNAGLFFFRGAQPPDVSVPTTPIQREKINLLLAEGFAGVRVAEDDPATMEFTNVDGELICKITVYEQPDLSEYVKKTQYADSINAGLVRVANGLSGLNVDAYGSLTLAFAQNDDIKQRNYRALSSSSLDEIVAVGMTTNTKALTEEEKASARGWLGAVGSTDYATTDKVGLVRVGEGLQISSTTNKLNIQPASRDNILNGTGNAKPISPSNYKYAVKLGVTTNDETLTDEEKASACKWLGAVAKSTEVTTRPQVYVKAPDGTQQMVLLTTDAAANAVPMYNAYGRLSCTDPTADYNTANKKYVDQKTTTLFKHTFDCLLDSDDDIEYTFEVIDTESMEITQEAESEVYFRLLRAIKVMYYRKGSLGNGESAYSVVSVETENGHIHSFHGEDGGIHTHKIAEFTSEDIYTKI